MSFATARVAPEKQSHRLPAAGPFCDVMEMDMEFNKEPFTKVFLNDGGQIVIDQPEEECDECGREDTKYVYFSPDRARLVAQEILRLCDEAEAGVE